MGTARLPTLFIPHGGGPWPWVPHIKAAHGGLSSYLEQLGQQSRPRAVLVVSAHWEAPRPTVQTAAKPSMLYDYYGFPEQAYQVRWPAPGAPDLAGRIQEHLKKAGFAVDTDDKRGFDHGVFVPMSLMYPKASIPTLQLSLIEGLAPEHHLRMGAALAPLREEGVLIVGSGMSYHNMRGFNLGEGARGGPDAQRFDDWLVGAVAKSGLHREEALAAWADAPGGRASHPREEHLLPLHVVAGAAHEEPASLPFRGEVLGVPVSAVQFGTFPS